MGQHDPKQTGDFAAAPQPLAVKLLLEVMIRGRALDEVLRGAELWPADVPAGVVKEICYGVLRWRWRLNAILDALLTRPLREREHEVKLLLLVGLYQLTNMKAPAHIVVNGCVQSVRELNKPWAVGLTNGILRAFLRDRDRIELAAITNAVNPSRGDEAKWSFPEWMITRIRTDWPDAWETILDVSNQRPPMSLRVNTRFLGRDAYLTRLAEAGIAATALPLCADGVVLEHPCPVLQLPGFQDGWVSVQDGGAQLAVDILAPAVGYRILDACAAPGGKTCHILERCSSLSELVAVDNDGRRMEKVTENLQRLSLSARQIVADAGVPSGWWDGVPFDRILLDVPCSASGVIRRHPDIKTLRRVGDLESLVANQRRLLAGLWPTLARGGILVYTTCSVFHCENREVLADFLRTHDDARVRAIDLPLGEQDDCGVQIIPGDASMDGFYYAALTKG